MANSKATLPPPHSPGACACGLRLAAARLRGLTSTEPDCAIPYIASLI